MTPDFAGTRARWLRGLCPCCGCCLCDWEWLGITHEPLAIAEGVELCGRCIGNEHHLAPPGYPEALLASLIP